MVENKSIGEFLDVLNDLIKAYLESDSMSNAELIGVLEMAKLQLFYNIINDEDDTEE